MNNIINLKNDFKLLYESDYSHVDWDDFLVHWHQAVSEFCIYNKNIWLGYVEEPDIFKSGFENYNIWNKAQQDYIKYEYDMSFHYTIMRILMINGFIDNTILTELLNDNSYSISKKIDTLNVIYKHYEYNKRTIEELEFVESLIQKYKSLLLSNKKYRRK